MTETNQNISRIIGRRYRILAEIGAGGMGEVYRARDLLTNNEVALKRVTIAPRRLETEAASTDYRMALAQEFRTLSSLRHPHIISVLDYGFDTLPDGAKLPFFTMDLLQDPRTILEASREQSLQTRMQFIIETLQALAYLHRRGIVHRDLKPANVLVVEGHGVKVLDFGLAVARGTSDDFELVGTLAYMAPEVLRGAAPTEESDLYAVGVIAYELIAYEHPFDVNEPTQLIQDVVFTPPDLSVLDAEVELVDIIERLLEKDPANRYTSADAVIADLARALDQAVPVETAAIRESFLEAAAFVGRDFEIAQLSTALFEAAHGRGSAWLVGGESGIGKSRLLDEMRTQALVGGALVLRGQAMAEGGAAYQIWRDVLRWLILVTDKISDEEASVIKALVPDIENLLDRDIPDALNFSPQDSQDRLLNTITALFSRQNQTVLVILEDLQWAAESIDLLKRLSQNAKEMPVMFVGSYRNDERPDIPDYLPHMRLIELDRLDDDEISELSEAMIGMPGRRAEVLDLIRRETEGNVFFIVEVVRALAEEAGHLSNIGEVTLPQHVFAGGIQQIVQHRLNRVPEQALPVLRASAVIGRLVDTDLLRRLYPGADVERWLAACANVAVLEVQEGSWRFAHDKLRESILDEIEPEKRTDLHRQVAITLERGAGAARVTELALHWRAAGEIEKERQYTRLAGDQFLATSSYAEAIRFYERALEITPDDDTNKVMILARLGEAHAPGDYNTAKTYLRRAAFLARELGDRRAMAQALTHMSRITLFRDGDLEQVRFYQQDAITAARATGDSIALAGVLIQQGEYYIATGDYAEARSQLQEGLQIARAGGRRLDVALALDGLSLVLAKQGEYDRATRLAEEIREIGENLGSRRITLFATSRLGYIALCEGHHQAALEKLREAYQMARRIGDSERLGSAANDVAEALFALDQPAESHRAYTDALRICLSGHLKPEAARSLAGIAHVWGGIGRPWDALELLSMVLNHAVCHAGTHELHQDYMIQLRSDLPEEQARTVMRRGVMRDFEITAQNVLAHDGLDAHEQGI